MNERWSTADRRILLLTVALALALFAALPLMLHAQNDDTRTYYVNWCQHIIQNGRLASLEGSYANYNPPYLYVLSFATLLSPWLTPLVIVKLAELPGIVAAAVLVFSICRVLRVERRRAALAGALAVLAPEVTLNAFMWGQADILYTDCLLGMVRLLLAEQQAWAMLVFGVALSFKLQAIFAAPFLGILLLSGKLKWSALLYVPVGYILMLIPALLAGRPIHELIYIYGQQASEQSIIASDACNPWELVFLFTRPGRLRYFLSVRAGLALAVLASLAYLAIWLRRRRNLHGATLLVAAALPLLFEPFLLPKMHDRYFFPGDFLLVLLAVIDRRFNWPAVLAQAAVLVFYWNFLTGMTSHAHVLRFLAPAAVACMTAAIVLASHPAEVHPQALEPPV